MAALASPDWGVGAAQLEWPLLLPANARFDLAERAPTRRWPRSSRRSQTAIRSDDFRFDARTRCRPEVAAPSSTEWSGCSARARPDNLDAISRDIAADIEAAWLDLEARTD